MFLRRIYLFLRTLFIRTFPSKKRPFTYVALGDSTVEGLGATSPDRTYPAIIFEAIKGSYKQAKFYNLGRLDSTAKDLVTEQLDKSIALSPDLVTISIGANDVRYRRNILEFEKDIQIILKRLKRETHAEIVINTIPNMSVTPAVPKGVRTASLVQVKRFNTRIERRGKEAKVIVVDLFPLSGMFARRYPEMLAEDGFHPSDFGYALWANTILQYIRHLLFIKNGK